MTDILHSVILAVGSLLATALVGLVAAQLKKAGLDLTTAQHDFLVKVANEGINYAEEKVANGTVTKDTKLSTAIDHVVTTIPGTTPAEAERAIHAALPDSNAGATVDPLPPQKP